MSIAEPITIDVILKAKDQTGEGIGQATKGLKTIEQEAEKVEKKVEAAKEEIKKLESTSKETGKGIQEAAENTKDIQKNMDNLDKSSTHAASGLKEVEQSAKRTSKGLDSTEQSTKKASKGLQETERSSKQARRSLLELAKEKITILLEAKDKLSPLLKGLTKKAWSISIKALDYATRPIRGILNLLKNPLLQAGAILGISFGIKDSIDTFSGFEAAMSKVKAISGASGEEFDQLTEKAKEMGATTKFTATEAAEGFNYMAMAGWKTEDMLNGIEGIMSLAAASGESLGTTSDIVTDAMTAFGMAADGVTQVLKDGEMVEVANATHFADVLAAASSNANTNVSMMGETFKYAGAMAGTLGYSIEDVALATGLMANAGVKGSMAGTALNSIFTRLATNTDGARDALKELGVEFFDANHSARDFGDVLTELRQAVKAANLDDGQKTAFAKKVAGAYAQKGLVTMLDAKEKDFEKLSDAINHADGAAKRMAEDMMDNLQGSITLLQSAADGVKLAFGERLKPYVEELTLWLTDMMPSFEQGMDRFMDRVDDVKNRTFASSAWKQADFFGKIEIAWDKMIAEPFASWWKEKGQEKIAHIAGNLGSLLGKGWNRAILAFLGVNDQGILGEGLSAGKMFVDGFLEGFEGNRIKEAIKKAIKGVFADSYFGGGNSSTSFLSTLAVGAVGKVGIGAGVSTGKGIYDTYSIVKRLFSSEPVNDTGTNSSGSSGDSSSRPRPLPVTSGASMSVIASVAGGVLGLMGLRSAIKDLASADKQTFEWDKDRMRRQGWTKAGLVATGAGIGSFFGPGVGTLIGAGIGGAAALIGGNSISTFFKGERERSHEALMQLGSDLKEAVSTYQETSSKMNLGKGLLSEYKELQEQMNSADFDHTKAEDVQSRMKQILLDLQTMFPDLISGYETLNGLSDERLAGLDKELSKMDEQSKRRLQQTVADTKERLPAMDEEYTLVNTAIEEKQGEWEGAHELRSKMDELVGELQKATAERNLDEIYQVIDQVNQTYTDYGVDGNFSNSVQVIQAAEELKNQNQALLDELDNLLAQKSDMDSQLQTYYDSSLKLIWSDTGIDSEQFALAKTNIELLQEAMGELSKEGVISEETRAMVEEILPGFSQAENAADQVKLLALGIDGLKESVQPALDQIELLNQSLKNLPEEKKINISLFTQGGFPALARNSLSVLERPIGRNARGKLTSGPELSWVGEDGMEAIIPLSGKYRSRGLELYQEAGKYLGVGTHAEGGIAGSNSFSVSSDEPIENKESGMFQAENKTIAIQVSVNPSSQITIQLEAGGTKERVIEALREPLTQITDQLIGQIAQNILMVAENIPGGA